MKFLLSKAVSFVLSVVTNTESGLNESETNSAVSPIYDFLDQFGPLLIGMLLGVGTLYCIILGVNYAKAEKGEERDTAKKKAVNAAISFGVIIILVILLYGLRDTFVKILND